VFIRSVWLSVWGWTAVDILRSIPKWLHIQPQKVVANCGLGSETIVGGSPWRFFTSCRNSYTNSNGSLLMWHGMECRILECKSGAIQISLNTSHFSIHTPQSIERCSHVRLATANSVRPRNLECWVVHNCWQKKQFCRNRLTSFCSIIR
jgi:hypothetical protein